MCNRPGPAQAILERYGRLLKAVQTGHSADSICIKRIKIFHHHFYVIWMGSRCTIVLCTALLSGFRVSWLRGLIWHITNILYVRIPTTLSPSKTGTAMAVLAVPVMPAQPANPSAHHLDTG